MLASLGAFFELAASAGDITAGPSDALVNIVCDERTIDEAFTRAGLILPNGQQLDVDEFGELAVEEERFARQVEIQIGLSAEIEAAEPGAAARGPGEILPGRIKSERFLARHEP